MDHADRIAACLASPSHENEREFQTNERPRGVFLMHLFEEDLNEKEKDTEESFQTDADDEFENNKHPTEERDKTEVERNTNIGADHNDLELKENATNSNLKYFRLKAENLSDLDDLENLALGTRLNGLTGVRVNGQKAYISRDKNIMWDIKPPAKFVIDGRNTIQMRSGKVIGNALEAKNPVDVWKFFINDEMIESIANNTNIWIDNHKQNYARKRDCAYTNPDEVKAVLGLLYLTGVMKYSRENFKDVYASDELGDNFFSLVISMKRLQFLLRAISFDCQNSRDEREAFDKMAKMRELMEQFVENCQRNYVVSEFVTIDEILEPFRGLCDFKVYMKNKWPKYGMKLFTMTCAQTFYTSNLEVFVGKQPEGPYEVSNSPKDVVERIIEPISGSGRNITTRDCLTSLALCADLLQNHQLTLVGELKKDKGEIPEKFVDTSGRPRGSSLYGFKQGCTLISHKENDNENVILLSSMHDYDASSYEYESKTFDIPEAVLFYNSSKGAGERVVKYKESYSVARITNRWPLRLFYSVLDFAGINSYIVLKANLNEPKLMRKEFLKTLAMELCKESMRARISIRATPTLTKKKTCELLGLPNERRRPPPEEVTMGRCYCCDWKKNRASRSRCYTCRNFVCKSHSSPRHCVRCFKYRGDKINACLSIAVNRPARLPPSNEVKNGRCALCSSKKNRKSRTRCRDCRYFICKEHMAPRKCGDCSQLEDGDMGVTQSALDQEYQNQEQNLWEPELRPNDDLRDATNPNSTDVLAPLTKGDDLTMKYKRERSESPVEKKRARKEYILGERAVKCSLSQFSCGYTNTDELIAAGRENKSKTYIKEEFEYELILEDCNNSSSASEDFLDELEESENLTEDRNTVHTSPPIDIHVPFETVICGQEIKVKKEITEDETDLVEPGTISTERLPETRFQSVDGRTAPTGNRILENPVIDDPLDPASKLRELLVNGIARKCAQQSKEVSTRWENSGSLIGTKIASSELLVISTTTSSNVEVSPDVTTTTTNVTMAMPIETALDTSVANTPDVNNSGGEDNAGVFISLKRIPLERREKTKAKLVKLVEVIAELELDPDEVSFSVIPD